MTENFQIPPGRCREEAWTAGARVQCAHLDSDTPTWPTCRAEPGTLLDLGADNAPVRRRDGKCPYGNGGIPVVQGSE